MFSPFALSFGFTQLQRLPPLGNIAGYGEAGSAAKHYQLSQRQRLFTFSSVSQDVVPMDFLQGDYGSGGSEFLSIADMELSDSDDMATLNVTGGQTVIDKDKLDPHVLENLELHQRFMRRAIETAEQALKEGETPVACVLVYKGEVVARGMNDTNRSLNGTRHAEFLAIAEFRKKFPQEELRKTDLYVTVEPCIMCASALRQYGIRCVYYGCGNDRFGGNGSVLPVNSDKGLEPGYPSYGGIFRKEAIMLLRRFYIQENENAPNPRAKGNRELKPVV
jgi:tRNA-specific adenosine deaminase 2